MRTVIEKGLLLVLCLFAAEAAGSGTDAAMVVALLAAVSATGLSTWSEGGRWDWAPSAAFALAALALPLWHVFLPLVAYDSARTVSGNGAAPAASVRIGPSDRSRIPDGSARSAGLSRFALLATHWIWMAPLVPLLASIRPGDDAMTGALVASATGLGFVLGIESQDAETLRTRVRGLEDRSRETMRMNRMRMADVAEERAQSVRMATLGERSRIAREIHDNVGHLLTRAIMQAKASGTVAAATGETVSVKGFEALAATLDDAMTMVRRSVHDLEDDGTDFAAQIADASTPFAADGDGRGLAVHLDNGIDAAPAPVARCLATVIRESLSNVAHHSRAREATVTLRDFPAFWQLVVEDPGPAVRTASTAGDGPARGMGVADIESRARALGGVASCGPHGEGWRVFVSIPKSRWDTARTVHTEDNGKKRQGKEESK